ncbi:MAG: YqzL family protein [Paenibacillus macerans]|uniref:YqzL family protein n=1 Tax=Paenibacillus macerans TaxID=44252 RepID=A0A091A194_PAEMA|nr:YqzL family protein [Paenibacillus macerans]KFN10056.1 yqzL-like family protein [Paenibacillus macerans]MBS5909723.1 YqzL family protein [Paenibacillus macerans]MCY7557460.1 YqzL family protein [Paenibacillus macerans]MDU7477773.1 YqzL family protein [Paenibacillus macerans]MEC0137053.1 YqzL family protein [Paenibacillus macerans]
MRDFSWKYFVMTGDVDAYLLYKEACGSSDEEAAAEELVLEEEAE